MMHPIPILARERRQESRTAGLALQVLELIGQWTERHRQRRALDRLAPHELRDIGLTAADARRECAKPFWR